MCLCRLQTFLHLDKMCDRVRESAGTAVTSTTVTSVSRISTQYRCSLSHQVAVSHLSLRATLPQADSQSGGRRSRAVSPRPSPPTPLAPTFLPQPPPWPFLDSSEFFKGKLNTWNKYIFIWVYNYLLLCIGFITSIPLTAPLHRKTFLKSNFYLKALLYD